MMASRNDDGGGIHCGGSEADGDRDGDHDSRGKPPTADEEMPPAVSTAACSLEQEFACETESASTFLNRRGGDPGEGDVVGKHNDRSSGGRDDDFDYFSPPPPPNKNDDDSSRLKDQIRRRHRHRVTGDHRNGLDLGGGNENSISDGNIGNDDNEIKKSSIDDYERMKSTVENTLECDGVSCGDDTMQVLMETELRLNALPPCSVRGNALKSNLLHLRKGGVNFEQKSRIDCSADGSQSLNLKQTKQQHVHGNSNESYNDQTVNSDAYQQMEDSLTIGGSSVGEATMKEMQEVSITMDESCDGLSTGLSTGVASLLRGPIMAAKSARRAAGDSRGGAENHRSTQESPVKVDDVFSTRDGVVGSSSLGTNCAGVNKERSVDGGADKNHALLDAFASARMPEDDDTPLGARRELLQSAHNPASTLLDLNHHTPCLAREELVLSEHRQRPAHRDDAFFAGEPITPSAARSEFLLSTHQVAPGELRQPSQPVDLTSSLNHGNGKNRLDCDANGYMGGEEHNSHKSPDGLVGSFGPNSGVGINNGHAMNGDEGEYDFGSHITSSLVCGEPLAPTPEVQMLVQSTRPLNENHAESNHDGVGTHGHGFNDSDPSQMRSDYIVSAQKAARRPPPRAALAQHRGEASPSTERVNFLTSPQDSVSTMGTISPSDGYIKYHAMEPLGEEGLTKLASNPTPSTQRRTMISPQGMSPPLPPTLLHEDGRVGRPSGRPPPPRQQQKKDHPLSAFGKGYLSADPVDSMIALGERQIAASANNGMTEKPGPPPKKPFLRKGTRMEPSALRRTKSNPDPVTPRTQQRTNASSSKNTLSNANSTGNDEAGETLSERKRRLARLERMQEDLINDFERRQNRKEEAQRDRQMSKQMAGRQKREIVKPLGETPFKARSAAVTTRDTVTPSRARPHSAPKRRVVNGVGVVELTPSQIRNSMRGSEDGGTPSHARRSALSQAKASSRARQVDSEASSQARRSRMANAKTPSSARQNIEQNPSSLENDSDANATPSKAHITNFVGEDNDSNVTPSQARAVEFLDENECHEDISEDYRLNACVKEKVVPAAIEQPEKSTKQIHPKSALRPQISTRPRTMSAARRRNNPCAEMQEIPSSDKRSIRNKKTSKSAEDNAQALEDWKRKEGEQCALIKNMRRRQEAALREAEGERERAKAWAAAKKESVEKWAKEQRDLIKKDRHKAANAALLATKKANKEMQRDEQVDANVEHEAMKAELEEMRLAMKKLKAEAGQESRRLKEQIRRQTQTISMLKSGKALDGAGTAMTTENVENTRATFEPRPHHVLGDCSSKQNAQQHQQQSQQSKTQGRTSADVALAVADEEKDEVVEGDTMTEDPTEHWLERHLTRLNNANNRLGAKVRGNENLHTTNDAEGRGCDDNQEKFGQRKPYNAANYGGKEEDNFYAQTLASQNNPDSTPQVPTAPSLPPYPEGASASSQPKDHHQQISLTKSQVFTYKNGSQKEVLADGTTTVSFACGDRKRTYANEKKGIVVYYYAATKTTQVTHQDGMQTYHFPNKQIENHYTDGRKEISYPDGTARVVHTDGMCETTFLDGVRVIDYPDGRQRVMKA